ncbi:hypothetical protein GCM10010913_08130 [Paenibacillus aceti]|uniref:Uncharacterized protein n=1 Tax=Paenibacillus aceti TaxID=1820010 RepID=A0ABQ1VR70_9BACL|nr:hypothetical protein GCM10010913_08130 [Paenibacillus aceti]
MSKRLKGLPLWRQYLAIEVIDRILSPEVLSEDNLIVYTPMPPKKCSPEKNLNSREQSQVPGERNEVSKYKQFTDDTALTILQSP